VALFKKFVPGENGKREGGAAALAASAANDGKRCADNGLGCSEPSQSAAAFLLHSAANAEAPVECSKCSKVQQSGNGIVASQKRFKNSALVRNAANAASAAGGQAEFVKFAPPSPAPKPAPDADDLEERAAIIAEGCGVSQEEATQLAARELAAMATPAEITQPTACGLEAERIESWLRALDRLPKACTEQGRQLERVTNQFWLGPWAHVALVAGWTDGELFSLASGLVPAMARQRLHIVRIDSQGATLLTGKVFPRRRTSDPPWWLDERVIGE
jgi:hypothetical protein